MGRRLGLFRGGEESIVVEWVVMHSVALGLWAFVYQFLLLQYSAD